MGITKMMRAFEKASISALRESYANMKICELGNQYMQELDAVGRTISAKVVYSALGAKHTSIDLNGQDGALVINLDKPIPDYMKNNFDLVTNYGTAEHVNNQFQVFKNIHDMTRRNGIMIHALPPVKQWPNHCRYYYSKEFVIQLAKLCNYEIINLKVLKCFVGTFQHYNPDMIMVTFLKTGEDFIGKDMFYKLPILDTGDLRMTGNYSVEHRDPLGQFFEKLILSRPVIMLFIRQHPRFRRVFGTGLKFAKSIKKRMNC